jgi:aminoglycoside 6'-N-acetyltransferase
MRDDDADYRLVTEWLSDPRVAEWYGGRDRVRAIESVRGRYRARFGGSTTAVFILHDGEPVGFLQFTALDHADETDTAKELGLDEPAGAFAIDLYIGDPEVWGQGIGSRAIAAFTGWLFDEQDATRVYGDPRVANPRSIRAFEKAGFTQLRVLPGHERHEGKDEDCWLLEARRPSSA